MAILIPAPRVGSCPLRRRAGRTAVACYEQQVILPLYDRPHAAIALLLLGASAAGGCAQQAGQPVAETCQATQEVLEGVVNGDSGESGESVDGSERRRNEPARQRVRRPWLHVPAARLRLTAAGNQALQATTTCRSPVRCRHGLPGGIGTGLVVGELREAVLDALHRLRQAGQKPKDIPDDQ